jgi:signal transduction histidine kinase
MLFAAIPEKLLHEAAQNEEHLALIKDLGIRSAMVVPIIAGERSLGAMTFITAETGRHYNESDLTAAVQLGNRAGIALENARLYQAEREARAAARAAEQRKDEFLAILGHELRNPLAPIVTALELMDLDPSSASFPKAREIIERQVRYLQRLVDDLLDVSRITTGKLQLRRETVEVSAAIRDAIEIASPILERRGHHLEVSLAEDAMVRGDRIRLAQVFSNLLTNAAKYTEPGGRIAVSARRGDSEVVIEVSDNGIGIDAEIAPRLFDLFVQGDRSFESHAVQGLGLGLTIVKRLIELHGGEISASSEGIGRGSRFEVRLPLKGARARHSTSVELTPIPRVDGDSQRVLIVDDNIDAAEILSMALRRAGFDTAVALDGPSALVQASSFKPEVALLDIGLPVMDGYELARRLLELSEPPRRLIAITGYGQAHDRDRALAAGFDNHFVKPVTVDAIIAALAI